ncbi:BatA domain-containing protein [uncultured Maribacter sp.]|uniref:BatA domain-containing protein n=1 Tax=uncultured Maribacter sp. TaxID=431308 RepID=UPI0030ED60F1|tara:strand:+ start:131190 stop:132485 length:1296 start_codon:yes stop_codon:yes gene_type:complete
MSFAHPLYLWTLLGLLVPIAIHLWSKKEAKTIKIGSIQLLSESTSKQSSSIQLNEFWLLLLRMLIVGLLSIILAKPQWNSKVENSSLTYIVEPELSQNQDFMARLDSLAEGQEIRILEKGFPIWEHDLKDGNTTEVIDYWSLASEMDALKTDSIVVFTNGYAKGLIGSRPETNHHIKWIVVEVAQKVEKTLIAYKRGENLQLHSSVSNSFQTKISSKNISLGPEYTLNSEGDSLVMVNRDTISKVTVILQKPIEVSLYYADSLVKDKRFLEAAFATLAQYLDREIIVDSRLDSLVTKTEPADLTIWLSEKPMPSFFQKILLFKKDSIAESLIETGLEPETYFVTQRINAENAVEQRLVESLLDILEVNKELEVLLAKVDLRSVAESELQTNFKATDISKPQLGSFKVSPYLWAALFILLLVERLVAYYRKQ